MYPRLDRRLAARQAGKREPQDDHDRHHRPQPSRLRPAGRIQDPNSKPRSIALVGIGEGGAAIARNIKDEDLAQLDVHVFAKSASGGDALAAIKAGGGDLQRDLTDADMIFIVACQGDDVGLAPVVSGIAHSRNHPVTALYIVPPTPTSAPRPRTRR